MKKINATQETKLLNDICIDKVGMITCVRGNCVKSLPADVHGSI